MATGSGVVDHTNTARMNTYPIGPVTVSGVFFVGCKVTLTAGEYPAPMDQSTPYVSGDGWFCYSNFPGGFNYQNLPANHGLEETGQAGFSSYWLLRSGY